MGEVDTIRGVWLAALAIFRRYPLATLVPAAILGAIGEIPAYLIDGRPVLDQALGSSAILAGSPSGDRYSKGRDLAKDEKEEITLLGKAVEEAMNEQIKNELFSAYQYLSMAAYCESENLPGFAQWMRAQSQEEAWHAMKFYDFVLERNGRIVLRAIDGPVVEFGSPLEVFEQALEHEKKVTAMINDLYGLAVRENDYASQTFLQWFVTEQVEEEKNAGDVVETLKMVGDKSEALFLLDRELGQRRVEQQAG